MWLLFFQQVFNVINNLVESEFFWKIVIIIVNTECEKNSDIVS